MNELKNTTMIWKRMNYSAQKTRVNKTAGLAQLKASLSHSLRTVKKKELEFNESLSHQNKIVYQGKMLSLDSLSIEQRNQIIDGILCSINSDLDDHGSITKTKNDRSKYASKLKNILKKEDEPEQLKSLISATLANKGHIDNSILSTLDTMPLKRASDKKSALTNYINLHNKVIGAETNSLHKNKTVIQESFFKFPSRNNIEEVKPADYLRIIYKFHKEHLPDYEIKACVFHGDETLSKKQLNNGAHPHIFIDGKNSKTGQYDLVSAQLNLVNDHLKKNNQLELKNNSFHSAQKIGEAYQRIVYEYVNKKLKEYGYSIEATISEKTIEHKAKLENIRREQNTAKISRSYNLLNQTLEEIEKSKSEKNTLDLEISKKIELLTIKEDQFKKLKSLLANGSTKLTKINQSIEENQKVIEHSSLVIEQQKEIKLALSLNNTKLNNDIKEKTSVVKYLNDESKKILEENQRREKSLKDNDELYQAIHNVDIAIDKIAFLNSERRDIKQGFNAYKERNIEAMKKMTRKQRIDFLEANAERFRREKLDNIISTRLSIGERTSLIVHDTTQAVKSVATKVIGRIIKP